MLTVIRYSLQYPSGFVQVELQFVLCPSSSSASAASACSVSVQAPNGEQCVLALARRSSSAGRTARFCARSPGCGHGRWRVRVQDARTQALLAEQELWLDGLGTLSFEVPALRLREQEFLRMPDACRECPGHRRFDQ